MAQRPTSETQGKVCRTPITKRAAQNSWLKGHVSDDPDDDTGISRVHLGHRDPGSSLDDEGCEYEPTHSVENINIRSYGFAKFGGMK